MSAAIIIDARRTPFGRLDGDLAGLDAGALAAAVIAPLRSQLPDDAHIDDVIVANATGPGGNLARRAALDAGCDVRVPGLTIDRQCGGGLDAIMLACRLVQSGAGEIYIAGGVESASTSPLRSSPSQDAGVGGRGFFPRRSFSGGGWDDPGMAESAELIAAECAITRERQDEYALLTHTRATSADSDGLLDGERLTVATPTGAVTRDGCLRPTLTGERIARMPVVTAAGGTVTAANASQIADGAAAVVVVSERVAARLGRSGLRHVDSACVGVEPRLCGLGAVAAAERLRERTGDFDPAKVTQIAMVEAFACQVCATIDAFDLDPARVNPTGGAIALGHPWGASGAAQVVRLFHALAPGEDGLALAAVAGGMGCAAWFQGSMA